MHESIITDLTEKFIHQNWTKKDLLSVLFAHEALKNNYPSEIRRATIIGNIANSILLNAGLPERCQVLAIGDIEYFGEIAKEWRLLIQASLDAVDISHLAGYDLVGQGSQKLRKSIMKYMSYYYDISLLPGEFSDRIIPSYGGTDSFVSIMNTLRILAKEKKINFIYPEASFLAHIKIAETILGKDSLVKLPKPESKNFFLSPVQIEDFYRNTSKGADINVFYITPVGNPTGNMVQPEDLYERAQQIIEKDPNAILIFDTVYVGLLSNEISRNLFAKIFSNSVLLERIIFTESISKTLGTTGIRLGWSWTMSPEYHQELKKYTTLTKAGFSKLLDEFTIHLLENPNILEFQNQVYEFWSRERLKFVNSMRTRFGDFFDFESSPAINYREGIYVLLKIRDNYSFEDVFAITGIIGVGIELSDGKYIRYAFGNVQSS